MNMSFTITVIDREGHVHKMFIDAFALVKWIKVLISNWGNDTMKAE
ncbi:MAG: hypothetical protein K0S61_1352 [Anaerocolumna sp.]|jgi:hypothetical protein|nr:hypothetical protein [Anaerocolumna sp.]